jgi:hypothetical protein
MQLIQNLRTAIQTRDGKLLVSLIDPNAGVAVQYIRGGNEIVYHDNFKFVFETTYEADWGLGAGSGAPVTGSFQEIVLPSLQKVFSSSPVLTCNSLKVGGATYIPTWPHPGMEFYSVYFPGTEQYGNMDWETWAVGVTRQEGPPVLAALIHYAWEP